MQGKQVVASVPPTNAVSADKIVKRWAPNQLVAEAEKRDMEREHDGRVMIR